MNKNNIPQDQPKQTIEELPTELYSVLAKISHINDLGKSEWYETVYYADDKWCSYNGSNTFNDGETVLEWAYCKDISLKGYNHAQTEIEELRSDKEELVEMLQNVLNALEWAEIEGQGVENIKQLITKHK